MTGQIHRERTARLRAFDDLILLRGRHRGTFLFLGHLRGGGMEGGLCVDTGQCDLDQMAQRLDSWLAEEDGEPPFPRIYDVCPDPFLYRALFDDGIMGDFVPDHVAEAVAFVKAHVPEVALRYLDRGLPINAGLDFFSSGDPAARLQAVRAYPQLISRLLVDEDLREVVDQRQGLTGPVRAALGLSPEQFRSWSLIQTRISSALLQAETPAAARDIAGQLATRQNSVLEASRILRPDQVPPDLDGIDGILACLTWAQLVNASTGIGMEPFHRMMRRVRPGEWAGLSDRLIASLPTQECQDYLRTISNGIAHAVAMAQLRDSGIDFAPLAKSAARLWAKEEIPLGDRLRLQAFLTGFQTISNDLRYLRSAVTTDMGEVFSLKDLREYQRRWHLTGHAIDDQVMSVGEEIEWPALAGTVSAGGFSFRELNGSAALNAQGADERHCVGGYTSIVLAGTRDSATVIFSAEREGQVISTLEARLLARDRAGAREAGADVRIDWDIRQNKASRNRDPGPEGREAADLLLGHLRSLPARQVLQYLRGLQSGTGALREQLQTCVSGAGCNILNPELPDIVIGTYADVLPKSLRRRTVQDWSERLAAGAASGAMARITECGARILDKMRRIDGSGPDLRDREDIQEKEPEYAAFC